MWTSVNKINNVMKFIMENSCKSLLRQIAVTKKYQDNHHKLMSGIKFHIESKEGIFSNLTVLMFRRWMWNLSLLIQIRRNSITLTGNRTTTSEEYLKKCWVRSTPGKQQCNNSPICWQRRVLKLWKMRSWGKAHKRSLTVRMRITMRTPYRSYRTR